MENKIAVQLQSNGPVPTIYVEGISQVALGFPNSRLLFHSLATKTNNETQEEVHQLAAEIVIPTSSLIDMLKLLSNQIIQNQLQIKNFGSEWIHKINESIDSLMTETSQQSSQATNSDKKKGSSRKISE